MAVINQQYILNLFDSSDMLEIEKSDEMLRRSERNPKKRSLEYGLSPIAKRILEAHTPISRGKLEVDVIEDNFKILKIEDKQEERDLSFEFYENPEVGVFLEKWICVNLTCPGCSGKLIKYASNSMPVVDIKCSNKEHDEKYGPKYYQVKSTESGKIHGGQPYFSLTNKFIKVGSTRFGKICHEVSLGDDISKRKMLIGYICIEYNYDQNNFRLINFDMKKSFFVIPDLLKTANNDDEKKEQYYTYLDEGKIPKITYNDKLCEIYLFEQIKLSKDLFRNIDLNQRFIENKYYEPIVFPKI
jgi:hypothetical protein